MRPGRCAIGLLASLLLLCALPLGAAQGQTGTVHLRFEEPWRLAATIEADYADELARAERARMDADADGTVTEAEAQARADSQGSRVNGTRIGLPLGRLYMDGVEHAQTRLERIFYTGAAGDVNDTSPMTLTWGLELTWPQNASAAPGPLLFEIDTGNHTTGGYVRLQPSYVLLQAPPGFAVGDTGGLPFGAKAEERRVLMPTGTSGAGWIRVAFVPAEKESPAPTALLPLLGLAFVATARRRAD